MRIRRFSIAIAAALALLTFTPVSNAAAPTVSGGVLVKTDDGYTITGTLRDTDGKVVGTVRGTLLEGGTGFTTCPYFGFAANACFATPPWACNLLGGEVSLNFQGTVYDAVVGSEPQTNDVASALCQHFNDPTAYGLMLFLSSTSHVPPGEFPVNFFLGAGTVQQITPTLFKWSGFWFCYCLSGPPS